MSTLRFIANGPEVDRTDFRSGLTFLLELHFPATFYLSCQTPVAPPDTYMFSVSFILSSLTRLPLTGLKQGADSEY